MKTAAIAQSPLPEAHEDTRGRRRAYLQMEHKGGRALRSLSWQKHDVMQALYALAKGREFTLIDLDDLMNSIELPPGRVYNALDRLEQEGWLRSFNGSCVELLSPGIAAVERAMTKPYRLIDMTSHSNKLERAPRPGLAAGSSR